MRILIDVEVARTSGPFRSTEAVAEAIVNQLTYGDVLDVDGSEYEVTDALWYGPPPPDNWREKLVKGKPLRRVAR